MVFDGTPSIEYKADLILVNLQKGEIDYGLAAPEAGKKNVDHEILFHNMVSIYESHPFRIHDVVKTDQSFGKELTMTVHNHVEDTYAKFRILVTPSNYYLLAVEFPAGHENDSCQAFLDSFHIQSE